MATVVVALALARRRLAASLVAGVGVAAIGVRGYLVPYTPRFAPQLVDRLPISAFDHEDREGGSLSGITSADETDADSASTPTGEDVVTALLEAGVVVPNGDDLALAEPFRQEWHQEMATIRDLDFATLADEIDDLTRRSTPGSDTTGAAVPRPSYSRAKRRGLAHGTQSRRRTRRRARISDRRYRGSTRRRPSAAVAPRAVSGLRQPADDHPLELLWRGDPAGDAGRELICPDCDARLFTYD